MNPVIRMANWVALWIWKGMIIFSQTIMTHTIFHPLVWSPEATQLYDMSRAMALGLTSLVMVWEILRTLWPGVVAGEHSQNPIDVIIRAVAAALWAGFSLGGIQWALSLNDAIVKSFNVLPISWHSSAQIVNVLTPIIAVIMAFWFIYLWIWLALYYAVRGIEIFLLTALVPWLAVVSIAHSQRGLLRNVLRELSIAVFIQSVHAAVFMLFMHLVSHGSGSVSGIFLEAGVLWYMTKVPEQLRRIIGLGGGGGMRLWKW